MVTEVRRPINEERSADLGSAIDTAMVEVGDKFGLYEAIAQAGPVTPAELAELAGIPWRHIRVWLSAQAAGDFLDYDEAAGRYSLRSGGPRGPADGHTFTGDAVRRFDAAQPQAAIAEEAARQTGINSRLGYRAIPGTAVRSVWDVRKQAHRLFATTPGAEQNLPSRA